MDDMRLVSFFCFFWREKKIVKYYAAKILFWLGCKPQSPVCPEVLLERLFVEDVTAEQETFIIHLLL